LGLWLSGGGAVRAEEDAGGMFRRFQEDRYRRQRDERDAVEREFRAKDRRLRALETRRTPIRFSADHQEYLEEEGILELEGNVRIRKDDFSLEADKVRIDERTGLLLATGDVLIRFDRDEVSCSRVEYNFETRRAKLWDCRGFMVPSIYFQCSFLEKLDDFEPTGKAQYYLEDAEVTSCEGSRPDWSFRAPRALARVEHYLHLNMPTFWVGRSPVLFSPYWVHPIKTGRVSGLLVPSVAFSANRGLILREEFFWAARDNVDVLLGVDVESEVGVKGRLEAEYALSRFSRGRFRSSYRKAFDAVEAPSELDRQWMTTFDGFHEFRHEIRAQMRANFRSSDYAEDPYSTGYYRPGERFVDSYLTVAKYWGSKQLRLEADLTRELAEERKRELRTLPRLEFDSGDERLGRSGFRWRLEASVDRKLRQGYESYHAGEEGWEKRWLSREATRFRLHPAARYFFTALPWLTITPRVAYRFDWWSDRKTLDPDFPMGNWAVLPEEVLDPPPNRTLAGTREAGAGLIRYQYELGVETLGPEFYRIYDVERGLLQKLKHVITPTVEYRFVPEVDDSAAIQFDAQDLSSQASIVTYGIENALYGKFARKDETSAEGAGAGGESAAGGEDAGKGRGDDEEDGERGAGEGAEGAGGERSYGGEKRGEADAIVRRVAFFRISQSYDAAKRDRFERHEREFERGLRPEGGTRADRPLGNVVFTTEISPVPNFSFDFDLELDPYASQVSRTNLRLRSHWESWWSELSWTRDLRVIEKEEDDFHYFSYRGGARLSPRWSTELSAFVDVERRVVDGLLLKLVHHAQCWSVGLDSYFQHHRSGVYPDWTLQDEYRFGISFKLKNIGDVGFFDLGAYTPGAR
jgi:lipopolysaccharide assembly outer membrane protein LptD (OstA)